MKKFVEPSLNVENLEVMDVIATSTEATEPCYFDDPNCPNFTTPYSVG